ncbi:MAG TPA: MBL fold metallo-hydrolase [Candidatus Saccharibacteria bacterium]|nr:MBL fold metallo-hydrolase [Candidatus Saccharibacteria bacterium]HRQ98102.1 MBL fold metallo-hydrolase [Candidatus Saccharibacteria bacterium]
MFEIEYKGGNTVVLSTKKHTVVIDPKLSIVGLKDLIIRGAVEIATEQRFSVNGQDAQLVIDGPGEYGIGPFDILGIPAQRHLDTESDELLSTIYRIEVGDVRIGVIGNIYEKLSDAQFEELGLIDILIMPVGGGGYTLDATGAANLVRSIDPRVVVPVHYADKGLKYEVPQDNLETFVSELGAPKEVVQKYKVKQPASIPATLTIIKLERS